MQYFDRAAHKQQFGCDRFAKINSAIVAPYNSDNDKRSVWHIYEVDTLDYLIYAPAKLSGN